MRTGWSVSLLVAMLVLVPGCTTVEPGAGEGPDITASAAELGRALSGPCPENSELIGAFDLVTGVDEWIHAAQIGGDRKVVDGRVPIAIVDTDGRTTGARLYGTHWRGIDWGLKNGADVWIGTSTLVAGNVRLSMVVTPSGEVFFPGECSDRYRAYFYAELGDRAGELLAGLPAVEPADAYEHLGLPDPYAPEDPSGDEYVILNDEDVDPSILAGLHGIQLTITITDIVGDGNAALCTEIAAGWNDCVMADADAVTGITIPVHADDSGRIEFWLLDGNGDIAHPLGRLGEATATGKNLAVLIDTSGIAPDGSFIGNDRVRVVAER